MNTISRSQDRWSKIEPLATFLKDLPLYLFEASELAIFMISACVFTVLLFHPGYTALRLFPNPAVRRVFMGVAMGLTAILIIHSPMGKRPGAHFNPAITLTYLRLGKITIWDAAFYVTFQFPGGILGVVISWLLLGKCLADPGSAIFADVWTAAWVYFVAPLLGMTGAAEVYVRSYGTDQILCAKSNPDPNYSCPFLCHFPSHRHPGLYNPRDPSQSAAI